MYLNINKSYYEENDDEITFFLYFRLCTKPEVDNLSIRYTFDDWKTFSDQSSMNLGWNKYLIKLTINKDGWKNKILKYAIFCDFCGSIWWFNNNEKNFDLKLESIKSKKDLKCIIF